MKRFFLIFFCLFLCLIYKTNAQNLPDSLKSKLIYMMESSAHEWNKGNLEKFMANYWQSDSLRFIGKRGITYGWNNTLNNYKKGYPDSEARGKLEFIIKSIEPLGKGHILMVGQWIITRKTEKLEGYFTLIWKKSADEWYIIYDHSS